MQLETVFHGLVRGSVAEDGSGSLVEPLGDCAQVGGGVDRKVGALGEVLSKQAVRVLVRSALPGRVGVAKVDPEAGKGFDVLVEGQLAALVPGERPSHARRDVGGLRDDGVADLWGLPAV